VQHDAAWYKQSKKAAPDRLLLVAGLEKSVSISINLLIMSQAVCAHK
jgi:hypothetical protein